MSSALVDVPDVRLTDVYGGFLYPVGSYNGLLCLFGHFLTNKHAEIWLYLSNPATRSLSNKILFLSEPHPHRWSSFKHGWKFAFGYDNSTDIYKIVAFHLMSNKVRVFSFGDNVWRNITSFPVVPIEPACDPSFYGHPNPYPSINNGLYVSGTLNWLSIQNNFQYKNQIDWKHITIDQFVIISLDLSRETYLQLLPPLGFDKVSCGQPTLTVLKDSLCFSHGFNGIDFIIWQMKEFGVQESWTQFLNISYVNLRNLVSSYYRTLLFPVCLSDDGDTLILAWGTSTEAILYKFSDNTVNKTKIADKIKWFLAKDYVESLVSIN